MSYDLENICNLKSVLGLLLVLHEYVKVFLKIFISTCPFKAVLLENYFKKND